jgi:thiol:disulfide interchange protein DsbD
VVSLVALALAAGAVARGSGQQPPLLTVQEDWQTFAPQEVSAAQESGRAVFVDFTAAWCLTCQVNERLVLSTERVMDAFRASQVALLKADWTRQDPLITAALEALGRSGVPVYALYPGRPGADPHILPALLTQEIVLDALAEVISPSSRGALSSSPNP